MRRDVMKPSYGNQDDKLFNELVVGGVRKDEKILEQPKTKVVDNDLMRRVAAMEDELKTVELKEKIAEKLVPVEKKIVDDGLTDNLRRYRAEKTETRRDFSVKGNDIFLILLAVLLLPTIIGSIIAIHALIENRRQPTKHPKQVDARNNESWGSYYAGCSGSYKSFIIES